MEESIKNHLRIMLEKVLGVGGFVMGDRTHKMEEYFEVYLGSLRKGLKRVQKGFGKWARK